jgi:Lrp/AsnC family transcriptional regulator for asnA, asnC and gidA
MDQTDISIIINLCQDARVPFSRIAKQLGVSPDTIISRYSALRKQGVVMGSTVVIDPRKTGYQAMAAIMIDASAKSGREKGSVSCDSTSILRELVKMPNVIHTRKTVGDHDLLTMVVVRDFEHLMKIRSDIMRIPGVRDMDICFWTGITELPGMHDSLQTFTRSGLR